MRRRGFSAALGALALLAAVAPGGPAPATAGGGSAAAMVRPGADLRTRYEVFADGFRFGEAEVRLATGGGRYLLEARAEAQGLLGLIIRSRYRGMATGRWRGAGRPRPERFHARSQRIFKDRTTDIRFGPGARPVAVEMTPARDHTRFTDPAAVPDARIDPLSYLVLLFGHRGPGCPAPAPLYDGRRLTRVALVPAAPRAGAPAGSLRCIGRYEIVDGPTHSILSGVRVFALDLAYGPAPEPGAPRPLERIEVAAGSDHVVFERIGPDR